MIKDIIIYSYRHAAFVIGDDIRAHQPVGHTGYVALTRLVR